MATQKTKTTWDVLQEHPIAGQLDPTAQLALLCEFVDLGDSLEGLSLADYIDAYFDDGGGAAEAPVVPEAVGPAAGNGEADEPEEAGEAGESGEDDEPEGEPRPASMVGLRAVYRFPGRNVLTDEAGVVRDANGVVEFTDVDGEPWSNIDREKVSPIHPDNYLEIHVSPREAKEITGWLGGTPAKGQADGEVLRNLFIDFPAHPDRITFAIMNGKRPFVDRYVQLPENGFEDDQKPTTRLFGEHCFRVRGKDYVVEVLTP